MKKPSKITRIVLAVVITLAVITGLFIARTYLKGKVEIFAEKAVAEKVLKYKSVANGDFSNDALTNVIKSGKKIILESGAMGLAEQGTIEGQIDLKKAATITKIKINASNLKPTTENTNKVNLEVNLSRDGQNWTKTYTSSHTTTINFAKMTGADSISAKKFKLIKYKVTLETLLPDSPSSSPGLTALTLWGKGGATCIDTCGDGTCQEEVCLAIGCLCAETYTNCPADCPKPSATPTSTSTIPPIPPGPGDSTTPPVPPPPTDSVTPPVPPPPTDSVTPPVPPSVVPLLTVTPTPEPSETPEESATASPAQTKAPTDLFNSPGGSVLVSGIQSGVSFTVLVIVVLGIGVIVIYRIAKSKE